MHESMTATEKADLDDALAVASGLTFIDGVRRSMALRKPLPTETPLDVSAQRDVMGDDWSIGQSYYTEDGLPVTMVSKSDGYMGSTGYVRFSNGALRILQATDRLKDPAPLL